MTTDPRQEIERRLYEATLREAQAACPHRWVPFVGPALKGMRVPRWQCGMCAAVAVSYEAPERRVR